MKEVTILGLGPTREQCPYDMETWGVNTVYKYTKRLDKLFIMDKVDPDEFDFDELRKVPALITSKFYPGFPNLEIYPLDAVLKGFKNRFFSNTICYMMAYALLHGYERIWMYGIDMLVDTCYVTEKGGVEYWMGRAEGMGVEVINTELSATGKTIDGKLYGAWDFEQPEQPEPLAQSARDFVNTVPGIMDLSEEWVLDERNNWVRRPQKVVQYGFKE